jgi:hypothetical protein
MLRRRSAIRSGLVPTATQSQPARLHRATTLPDPDARTQFSASTARWPGGNQMTNLSPSARSFRVYSRESYCGHGLNENLYSYPMDRIWYPTQDASKLRLRKSVYDSQGRGSLAPKAGLGKAKPTFPLTTRTLGLRTFALASCLEEQQKSYSSLWLRLVFEQLKAGGIQGK